MLRIRTIIRWTLWRPRKVTAFLSQDFIHKTLLYPHCHSLETQDKPGEPSCQDLSCTLLGKCCWAVASNKDPQWVRGLPRGSEVPQSFASSRLKTQTRSLERSIQLLPTLSWTNSPSHLIIPHTPIHSGRDSDNIYEKPWPLR